MIWGARFIHILVFEGLILLEYCFGGAYVIIILVFSRKIMVDSRFRKSGVPGSFTYELARAITLPTKCAGFVTDVEMLHSWYNKDTHNRFFYYTTSPASYRQRNHRVELQARNYDAASLRTELQTKINAVLINEVRHVQPHVE